MSAFASMCAFLGFFFMCSRDHGTVIAFETQARMVLFPPYSYWLYRRSAGADTSFTGKEPCVEIEYITYYDDTDTVWLDSRNHTKKEQWAAKMYMASVKKDESDVLQYKPADDEVDTAGTVEYRVLEVMQNFCYVVEKISEGVPEVFPEEGKEKVHNCELWLKKEKEVGHQRPTYTTESLKACKKSYDVLCMNMQPVYSKRLCDPISASK
uniref:Putative secreted protein n=1 Tax=Amblyomma triste TaxID=251400 RepID=A0A023GDH1_AMBTT